MLHKVKGEFQHKTTRGDTHITTILYEEETHIRAMLVRILSQLTSQL